MRFFVFNFLIISFLACDNSSKNMPSNEVVSVTDSLAAAIVEDSFQVVVKCSVSRDGKGYKELSYVIGSSQLTKGDWETLERKTVAFDSRNYKLIKPDIRVEDVDKDGVKDIMVLLSDYESGKREYKLFLIKNRKLVEVTPSVFR